PLIPLLGNFHQLPPDYQEKTFAQWGAKYGDIIYAQFFMKPTIILNSVQAARDLLEKRSSKYSGRPHSVLQEELLGWDRFLVYIDYGDLWRKHRKWIHGFFNDKTALTAWQVIQHREVSVLLSSLVSSPARFETHLKRYSSALIMETVYGHTVRTTEDEYVHIMNEAMRRSVEGEGAATSLVDFIPILNHLPTWMPGAQFKREALVTKVIVREAGSRPYNMVKTQHGTGTAKPSVVESLIETSVREGSLDQDEIDIIGTGSALYGPGTDTTTTVMMTFFLAMTLHPETLRKAQEEVDRVVGPDRLPDFSDRESLPYTECIFKECHRWICPSPLGIPHRATEDDEYLGYHIPKGTMIIPNIWSVQKRPYAYVYLDPQAFRPERYLTMDSATAEYADPLEYTFGFGRRICPGRQFADTSVWLAIAGILATMTICKERDATGKEVIPEVAYTSGIVSHVHSFTCAILPRSEQAKRLISQTNLNIGMCG
ncbi:cytochrome P450, partial [Wolfiporia cocos MD-104 SS10]